MIINLSQTIKALRGKRVRGKIVDRAYLTYDENSASVIIRVHFSSTDYLDHTNFQVTDNIEAEEIF